MAALFKKEQTPITARTHFFGSMVSESLSCERQDSVYPIAAIHEPFSCIVQLMNLAQPAQLFAGIFAFILPLRLHALVKQLRTVLPSLPFSWDLSYHCILRSACKVSMRWQIVEAKERSIAGGVSGR